MKNLHAPLSILIDYSISVMKLTIQEIRYKFLNNAICLMKYIDEEIDEDIIEIRFNEEQATLTCTFDENNQCICTFLFLDNLDIDSCVNYFNMKYEYDFVKSGWVLSTCYLAINRIDNEVCFVFCRPF